MVKNKWSHSSIPPKWPSFHGPDWFVVKCVISLIPKYSGVHLQFYDFAHPSSKPLASKLTWWNLDFTFLRGPLTMNVKAVEWKFIFKTYFYTASDVPRRHHVWSKSWCCVPLPCTHLWTNKTQHKEILSISHQLTASLFRPWHRLLHMKAQNAMKLKLQENSSQWPQQGFYSQLTWWWLEVPPLLAIRRTVIISLSLFTSQKTTGSTASKPVISL